MFYSIAFTICLIYLNLHKSESAGDKSVIEWPKATIITHDDGDGDGIKGIAGKDYPAYWKIPKTSFTCNGQLDGYYADTEAACQVFHFCIHNKKTSFLCGNGTIFNQRLFTCDWWYYASCSDAPNYYSLNSKLYKETTSEENKKVTTPSKESVLLVNPMRLQMHEQNPKQQQHELSHDRTTFTATMKIPVRNNQHDLPQLAQVKKPIMWRPTGVQEQKSNPQIIPQQRSNVQIIPQQMSNAQNIPQQKSNVQIIPQQRSNVQNIPQHTSIPDNLNQHFVHDNPNEQQHEQQTKNRQVNENDPQQQDYRDEFTDSEPESQTGDYHDSPNEQ